MNVFYLTLFLLVYFCVLVSATIDDQSEVEKNLNLKYFKFAGRMIGKAIYDNQLVDAHFTRSFYKHMLGIPVSTNDMEAIDPQFYKSLRQILDHKLEDLMLGRFQNLKINKCFG